ncbi:hypothetical protein N0V82_007774 [Gnomoniopsis sp. IMI 355080]|nr:hypothetical protein N0V82_007774 [Gnomoniopsis sp. IMI 355080]
MLASSFFSALVVAATALASPAGNSSEPAAPATKYLFTANIYTGAAIQLGQTPAGQRAFQSISGGTFSGPGMQGTIVGGLDYGLVDGDGYFNPDVVYLLQTSDACDILVHGTGHVPNVLVLFETACAKYDWLNGVVAYGLAAPVAGGISTQVFKVGVYED